jgi:hypothetical protein
MLTAYLDTSDGIIWQVIGIAATIRSYSLTILEALLTQEHFQHG